MRIIAALLLILCLSWPGFSVQSKKRPSSHTAAASKKPVAKGTKKGRPSAAARRAAARRKNLAQTVPTPERYQQIQQALVAKGYGPQAPDGVWSPEWASALKRFQEDRKLEPTGKLNSLSLITLGLGPKRDQPAGATTPAAPQPAGATAPPGPPAATTPAALPGATGPRPRPRIDLQVQAQPCENPNDHRRS